jgi:aryl-alcohol dehydrogenase-like predicted oxidoreductase
VDRGRAFRAVEAMRPIAVAHSISVARVALAWVLQQPAIKSVIIGGKSQDQLADNLAASELQLTQDELATLNEVSKMPREYPGWMFEQQLADRLPS